MAGGSGGGGGSFVVTEVNTGSCGRPGSRPARANCCCRATGRTPRAAPRRKTRPRRNRSSASMCTTPPLVEFVRSICRRTIFSVVGRRSSLLLSHHHHHFYTRIVTRYDFLCSPSPRRWIKFIPNRNITQNSRRSKQYIICSCCCCSLSSAFLFRIIYRSIVLCLLTQWTISGIPTHILEIEHHPHPLYMFAQIKLRSFAVIGRAQCAVIGHPCSLTLSKCALCRRSCFVRQKRTHPPNFRRI